MTGPRPWPGAWMVSATTACTTRLPIGSMADQVLAAGVRAWQAPCLGGTSTHSRFRTTPPRLRPPKTVFCRGRWPAGQRSPGPPT